MADAFTSYDPATPVGDEELDLAETDAGCRETSGYLDALYDAEWQEQLTVPHDYGERLAQIDTGPIVAAQQLVARTIERLGPERPTGL
jgi:fructosamine-3-kinase